MTSSGFREVVQGGECEMGTGLDQGEEERGVPGGGGRLGFNFTRMCVSKREGHRSLFSFK